eukprot:1161071-Pelagomonas_calceolata.AAC.3
MHSRHEASLANTHVLPQHLALSLTHTHITAKNLHFPQDHSKTLLQAKSSPFSKKAWGFVEHFRFGSASIIPGLVLGFNLIQAGPDPSFSLCFIQASTVQQDQQEQPSWEHFMKKHGPLLHGNWQLWVCCRVEAPHGSTMC